MSNFEELVKQHANYGNEERKERVYISAKKLEDAGSMDVHIVDFFYSRRLFSNEDMTAGGRSLTCWSNDGKTGYLRSDSERLNPMDCTTCPKNPKNMAKIEGQDMRAKCQYMINIVCDNGDDKETILSNSGNDTFYRPDKSKPGKYIGTSKHLADYVLMLKEKNLTPDQVTTTVTRESYGVAKPFGFKLAGIGFIQLTEAERDFYEVVSTNVRLQKKKGVNYTEEKLRELILNEANEDTPTSLREDEDRLNYFISKVMADLN